MEELTDYVAHSSVIKGASVEVIEKDKIMNQTSSASSKPCMADLGI